MANYEQIYKAKNTMIIPTRLNKGEQINVCTFNDNCSYPIYYKFFSTIEEAAKFYATMLQNPNIHTIVTRVIRNSKNKK